MAKRAETAESPSSDATQAPIRPEIPPSDFRAPPFRLRAGVFAVSTVLFLLLAADVHFDGAMRGLDLAVGAWVAENVAPSTQRFAAEVLALPGDDPVIFSALAVGAAWVALLGRWRTAMFMMVSGLALGATVWTLKDFFEETRPNVHFGSADGTGLSHAFPSGHTTDTTGIVGLLLYFLAYAYVSRKRLDPKPLVVPLTALWILVSVVMGLLRVFGGVHWPSDVLGGWLLGTAWLTVTITAHDVWVRPFEQLARGRRPLNEAVL